jgi:FdhD protein
MTPERRNGPTVRSRVHDWRDGQPRVHEDRVIAEEPMEIRLAWPGAEARRVTVTMRTPGADFELAAGFTVGEGLAGGHGHIATVGYCTDRTLPAAQAYNVTTVTLNASPRRAPAVRNLAQTSACGVCGKDSLAAIHDFGGRPVRSEATVPAPVVSRLPHLLRTRQRLFDRTGAVHAAALFDPGGEPLLVREDVGRHNAVDKVVGAAILGTGPDIPDLGHTVLCTSARAGFEIVQKAVMAGIPVVAAVGAASSMAVDCAREYGVTLVGFVRDGRFVVYTGPDRIVSGPLP